ncbi:MAG: hypothetical protein KatS3mg088_432 [Patescibacteria group bacterium]|nr:MAG: hypothetical protein KatS3mg088_432 [Patescibacteria group bacterium]
MRRKSNLLLLLFAILLSFILRFWQLGDISFGLHADEASQAYNAFSILKTGKDMYGKSFPVLFRANGSYQPPVYTYLTIFPVLFFWQYNICSSFCFCFIWSSFGFIVFFSLVSIWLWQEKRKVYSRGICSFFCGYFSLVNSL